MKIRLTMLGVLLLACGSASAGEIEVNWYQPEKYTDVKGANESNKRFKQRTFKQFEAFFAKQAQSLPEDVKIKLTITNLNLAGDVRHNFSLHREIRLVTQTYWPMIEFEYQITAGDKVVDSGKTKLKDMSFLDRGRIRASRSGALNYEKRMLKDWFRKDVEKALLNWRQHQNAVMAD